MEDIKLLVQEEGRAARNLIGFNVPVIETHSDTSLGCKLSKKPPTSPRLPGELRKEEQGCCKRSRESTQSGSRVRSASTGRDKKSELHARYWAFLFGNLQRAVDEIYQTCESDESVTECKEVIMVLNNYTREFTNLINWFKIKWEYETTPPPQRPRSLAWEIRKSSPGKIRHRCIEPVLHENIKNQMSCGSNAECSFCDSKNQTDVNKNSETVYSLKEETESSESRTDTFVQKLATLDSLSEVNETMNKITDLKPLSTSGIAGENESGTNQIATHVSDCKGPDHDPNVNFYKNKTTPTMIDEISQTDPEKDVDENGPKYRSTSQQTCSINDIFKTQAVITCAKTSENLDKTVSGGVTKILKAKTADDTKTSVRPLTSPGNGKTVTNFSSNFCSRTVCNQGKILSSPKVSLRTGSLNRVPKINVNNKLSVTNTQRESWGEKPQISVSEKPIAVSMPLVGKITRSQTIAGVQRARPNLVRTLKSVSSSKQNVNGSSNKPTQKVTEQGNISTLRNLNTTTLSSLTVSSIKNEMVGGSVEVLTSQENENEEDDGWVKVKTRSRFSLSTKTGALESTLSRSASNLKPKSDQKISKMIHKSRFHQPSSAISLPTLAFSSNDTKENSAAKKPLKTRTDLKSKLKENLRPVQKEERAKLDEINNKKKSYLDKNRRNYGRLLSEGKLNENNEKMAYNKIEKMENAKNLGNKISHQVNKSILPDQDPGDEEENTFDEEIKKNKEEEEMLQKEINDLEAADIEMDIETGDEETDGEATTGTEEELDHDRKTNDSVMDESQEKPSPKKQHRFETILSGMSWADHMDTLDELEKLVVQDCSKKGMSKDEQMDTLERLEEFVARHPGRALELHQKLSSPSRRRTMLDTVKRFQARQAKALEKREQLKMEKAQKLRELLKKVDEVKAAKDKLIEDRRQRLEMKLKRAAENRNLHLKEIMRKAHDEEEKLKEIAFINELEAQNKRHDFMTQCQEQEGRLQGIYEERQRKQEEKAAKEAAFEERRKAIEAERQEKLEKMQERQRKRDEQADKKKQEKEKERQELAREKARDRSERLEALHAAQLEAQEELQKKIQQKQEEYARRHEENIEQIRQKALELSILKCSDDIAPKLAPYETQKLCTACNVLIGSEVYLLSHLRGKKHQDMVRCQMNGKELHKEEVERYNIKIIVNAPSDKIDPKIAMDKERLKSFRKKFKKIRLRIMSKGEEYLSKLETSDKIESPGKGKLQKCLRDIEKVVKSQGKGQWSDNGITMLERSMGEISRTLIKQDTQDQVVFRLLNGFAILNSVLLLDMEVPPKMAPFLPQKCFVTVSSTYLAAVNNLPANCEHVLLSNYIVTLLDLLMKRLSILIPEHAPALVYHSKSSLPVDPLASVLMRVIAKILAFAESSTSSNVDEYLHRLRDIISYAVSSGIVDKLTKFCKSVRDPVDDDQTAAQFLLSILELLTTLTSRCKTVRLGEEDSTQLLATLQVTELVGAVSILYGMLLHQGAPPKIIDTTPPFLPAHIVAVALGTIRLLRSVAELDLQIFQGILGAEGISLQFRHIASYLLWYCCHHKEKVLLHEVVAVVGYFAVLHRDNQMILQSGSTPTVLQQLCSLPFPYFSNPELSALLFPTLLACCFENEENTAILEQEISYSLLQDFVESDGAKNHPLVVVILSAKSKGDKS